jgi:hypothetical protein
MHEVVEIGVVEWLETELARNRSGLRLEAQLRLSKRWLLVGNFS